MDKYKGLEFNTIEDFHTVLNYKIAQGKSIGYVGPVFINIDRLCELHEEKAKIIAEIGMYSVGIL